MVGAAFFFFFFFSVLCLFSAFCVFVFVGVSFLFVLIFCVMMFGL